MNWIIGIILPYILDAVFAALMNVLKGLVSKSDSDVDDKLVNVLEKEAEPIKKLVMDQARKKNIGKSRIGALGLILFVVGFVHLFGVVVFSAETCDDKIQQRTITADQKFSLCWDSSPSEPIAKYKIYRDGELVDEVIPSEACIGDTCKSGTLMAPGLGTFIFTIKGGNSAGNSEASNEVTIYSIPKVPAPVTGCGSILVE